MSDAAVTVKVVLSDVRCGCDTEGCLMSDAAVTLKVV